MENSFAQRSNYSRGSDWTEEVEENIEKEKAWVYPLI